MGEWIFAKQRKDSERSERTEEAHFKDDGLYESFIREVIQNSLDARVNKDTPVIVSFSVLKKNCQQDQDELRKFFERLSEPLKSDYKFDVLSELKKDFWYLVCEDFNTRGLGGDIRLTQSPNKASTANEDFFWFWRNSGNTGKTTGGGSWGVGKSIYNALSKARTQFSLTVRNDDGKCYLIGKSYLKIHEYQGIEYEPNGFWCNPEKQGGEETLPLPIESPLEIEQFSKIWNVNRTEPGLSVVVPFVDKISAEDIVRYTMRHFLLKILQGGLVVKVKSDDSEYEICRDNMIELSRKVFPDEKRSEKIGRRKYEEIREMVQFVHKILPQITKAIEINLDTDKVPNEVDLLKYFENMENTQKEAVLKCYSNNEPLLFKVKFLIKKEDAKDWGACYVAIQKKEGRRGMNSYFVRNGMAIPKEQCAHANGIGLVFTDETPISEYGCLAKLLRDSENPSHSDWEPTKKLEEKGWKQSVGRVKFVKGILTHIQKGLNLESTNTQKSYDVLGKFFSAPLPTGKSGNLKTNSGSTSAPPERPIRSRKECFQIVKICGGFRIIPGEVSPPKNAQIEILVAYDIATGNPFKRWCKYDFNFYQLSNGKIEVDSQFKDRRKTNPKIDWKLPTPEESIGNCIVLKNIREKFSFELTGFDPNRDLIVKAELKTKAKMEETPNETQD